MVHPSAPTVEYSILWVFIVLAVSTILAKVFAWLKPERALADLLPRLYSWWAIVTLVTVALVLQQPYSLYFFGLVSFLALKEFYSMIPTRRVDRSILFWAYLAIPIQYYWIHIKWYDVFIIFIPIYMFLLLPMRMALMGATYGFLRAASTTQWGLMTCVLCISHIAYLGILDVEHVGPSGGAGLIMLLLLLTEGNDIAQYVWGKTLGRTKILPKVSPTKTWEGFLGGLATTVGMSYLLAPYLSLFTSGQAILAGVLIGVSGFIGDVVMSAIKRDLGIKDTGTTLPGHGGVLDRVDSLIYTAPIFFHFCFYLYY
ncbi:MAG: phosphatidate cytidylyltransferase [Bacillota bacterium]|nr:MAG: phosphatidate cytidylyltransferase [Planctomycetota bacterium]RUA09950.1 MAG: phosphatidate cytidylyltransferase [Bacillota bacterium]